MNADDFIKNLNNAINRTADDMAPVMEEAALSAKALLARRVQNLGFGRKYVSRGYVKLRASRGFEVRFVNLTFTGNMFSGWKHPSSYRQGLKIGGSVGGIDQETKNKLRWNKSRFPSFDTINEEEKGLIKNELITPRLKEILKKNMFNL